MAFTRISIEFAVQHGSFGFNRPLIQLQTLHQNRQRHVESICKRVLDRSAQTSARWGRVARDITEYLKRLHSFVDQDAGRRVLLPGVRRSC